MDVEDVERLKAELTKSVEEYKAELAKEVENYKEGLIRQREKWLAELAVWVNFQQAMARAGFDFAALAMRSLILVNGGAVIAVLTFLGHFIGRDDSNSELISTTLGAAVAWFAGGLGVALLVTLAAYMSQTFFNERPIGDTKKPVAGIALRLVAIGGGLGSLIAFLKGTQLAATGLLAL